MNKKNILVGLCCSLLLSACSLDYENTEAITPDAVWKDPKMINAFLNDIYGNMMPGWPITANNTDEGMNGITEMSQYVRGEATVMNSGVGLDYKNIDKINFFLDNLEATTVLTEDEKKPLIGQALFWRAWAYWDKVFQVGGVPLILKTQDVSDINSLILPRNSTTECVTQILADLDEAITSLPDTWENEDYGRIDKGCAMAFKGRVLLQYASPLFNPNNDQKRWQDAYEANKAAVDFLQSVGKGLYEGSFADIWYDEQNKEVIMVNQFYYPDHALDQKNIRPACLTKDMADQNQAILPLVMAFPKIDGTPLNLDLSKLSSDESYNEKFMTDFYVNRDPRFRASIFLPGTEYPASDKLPNGMRYWNTWMSTDKEGQYSIMLMDELGGGSGSSYSGFYQRKGIDESLTVPTVYDGETDWIEIRFAEVLMNMGEAANEIGKTNDALQVLYDIRKRAGIQSTDGKYGITATNQTEIRDAYIKERYIEFAYENKRWPDLRRWKRFDILNDLKYRSTLYAVIKDKSIVEKGNFDWTWDMMDYDVRKLFRFDYIECVDGDKDIYKFNLSTNHWFYPIKKDDLDRNSKLEQNNEWGGTFDPLK